jgi:hypothetical protein
MAWIGIGRVRRILAGLAALALILGNTALAEVVDAPRTVDLPIFTENQLLNLPRNASSFWFQVPSGTVLSAAQLRLRVTASDTLIGERSSITLALNGENLATRRIPEIAALLDGLWTVDIPVAAIRTDGSLNELRFTTAQRSIEGDCVDIDNLSNWVQLREDSRLRLTVAREGALTLSGVLPRFYDTLENSGALSTEFVLGASPSNESLAAMLRVAGAVGDAYPYRDDVNVAVSAAERSAIPNKIYVGREALTAWPGPAGTPGGAGEGVLAVAQNGGVNRLLLYGSDEAGLDRAAALLANGELLRQAGGTSLTLTSDVPRPAAGGESHESGYYALSDFGYNTVNLAGAFHQEATFTLTQPGGLMSGRNSYVEIRYRHSEALLADNSLLTVYVNGTPMGSAKLSSSNAGGGKIKVRFPAEALAAQNIRVKVEVYNYLGRVDCSKDYSDTAWTVIDKDSVVYFEPGERAIQPTLSGFPSLSQGAEEAVLAVRSGAPAGTYDLAAALAVRAGQANGQAGAWRVANLEALPGDKADADFVILTDNEHAALPEALKNVFAVAPEGNGRFRASSEVSLPAELMKDKIVFQVARSPWSFDRRVYLVTYPEGMEAAALALVSNRSILKALGGSAAFASASGNVSTLTPDAISATVAPPMTLARAVYLAEIRTGYPIEWMLVFLAALAVIAFLIVRAARNKSRFKKAAEDVRRKNTGGKTGGDPPEGGGNPPEDGGPPKGGGAADGGEAPPEDTNRQS